MGQLITKKGNPNKPPRVLIYGVEGVGKSTFGARAESPIFISPEGGTDQLTDKNGNKGKIDEMPEISTFADLKKAIASLTVDAHSHKTLVIDSADWVEKLAHAQIIGNSGKSIITCNGGYGAGYRQSEVMHKELIDSLSKLREKRNMEIVVTAHAHVKPVKDPSMMEDYDSYEIKCHEMVSSLWREWVDALFFVRFKTFTRIEDGQTKARALTDGSRVLFTVKQPSFQAKNRYGLKPEYEFTVGFHDEFVAAIKNGPVAEEAPVKPSAGIEAFGNAEFGQTIDLADLRNEIEQLLMKVDDSITPKVREALRAANNEEPKLVAIRDRLIALTGQGVA